MIRALLLEEDAVPSDPSGLRKEIIEQRVAAHQDRAAQAGGEQSAGAS